MARPDLPFGAFGVIFPPSHPPSLPKHRDLKVGEKPEFSSPLPLLSAPPFLGGVPPRADFPPPSLPPFPAASSAEWAWRAAGFWLRLPKLLHSLRAAARRAARPGKARLLRQRRPRSPPHRPLSFQAASSQGREKDRGQLSAQGRPGRLRISPLLASVPDPTPPLPPRPAGAAPCGTPRTPGWAGAGEAPAPPPARLDLPLRIGPWLGRRPDRLGLLRERAGGRWAGQKSDSL